MQTLAPFRLAPYFRTRIWGFQDLSPWFDYHTDGAPIGEVWFTGDNCMAETGPCAGQTLKEIAHGYNQALLGRHAGNEFPLLVKIIFPKEKLSVQVHPDDAMAQAKGEPWGKTECWYALDAQPGAQVALGLKPGATAESVRAAIVSATLEDLLEWVPVHKGDMLFVDAGTVHAIAPGAVLLETQQNSDMTYRMYDYGRPRELHLDESLQAMRLTTKAGLVPPQIEGNRAQLIQTRYFRIDRFTLQGERLEEQVRFAEPPSEDGAKHGALLQMLFVQSGEARIYGPNFAPFALAASQLAVIPAASPSWKLEAEAPLELIRILPQ